MTIKSTNLYYLIQNSETKVYALQSISSSKSLENKTFNTIQQLDELIAEKKELSDGERTQIISILRDEYAVYI